MRHRSVKAPRPTTTATATEREPAGACPLIKYHFHTAQFDVPRLGARKGDRLCHVYSDRSIEELLEWGEDHGLRPGWIDRRNVLPHFDVLAERVAEHEPGVGRGELVEDIRWWRDRGRPRAGFYAR